MKREDRILIMEAPDTVALIDFIDRAEVRVTIEGGTLRIVVKATHGPGASSWDEHEFEAPLPQWDAEAAYEEGEDY